MLDTLEVGLVQARAGEIGLQEFLQVLCKDELNRRAAAAVTRRVRAARFEEQASLEDFDVTVCAKLPVHAIRDLATLRFLERAESVVLHGSVGIGKSHIAQALGNLACRRNLLVTFLKASRALTHYAGGHADRTWTARLRKLANVDLLILD